MLELEQVGVRYGDVVALDRADTAIDGYEDVLSARDDQTLFEIVNRLLANHHLELTRQAISQHLQMLEEAGLVRSRREGRYRFHTLELGPLRDAVAPWLDKE